MKRSRTVVVVDGLSVVVVVVVVVIGKYHGVRLRETRCLPGVTAEFVVSGTVVVVVIGEVYGARSREARKTRIRRQREFTALWRQRSQLRLQQRQQIP